MKNAKNYISFVHRCIAYVLLISQLLTSCGSPTVIDPQGAGVTQGQIDDVQGPATEDNVEEDDAEVVVHEEPAPTAIGREGACLGRCRESAETIAERTGTCLRRCRTTATPIVNDAGRRMSLAGEAIRPIVSNAGTRLRLAGEAARPVLGRASQRLSVAGAAARASVASMASRAATTSCGERILGARYCVGNALFMLKYNLEHIHDEPAPFVDSDEEPTTAPDAETTTPDAAQQGGILDAANTTEEGDTGGDIEQAGEGTDVAAIPQGPNRFVVMAHRVKDVMHECHKAFRRFSHKQNCKRTKILALGGATAALGMTAMPHWRGFWIDDTGCVNPIDCLIATESFKWRAVQPERFQVSMNNLAAFTAWHREKVKQLVSVWYQQQPCALVLLNDDNSTHLQDTTQEHEEKLLAYLACIQEKGEKSINTTEGLWQYMGAQSRANVEKLDTEELDATGRTIVTELNKNTQSNLGEGVRLQAHKMGEHVKATEQFRDEGLLDKMKQNTINQVSSLS